MKVNDLYFNRLLFGDLDLPFTTIIILFILISFIVVELISINNNDNPTFGERHVAAFFVAIQNWLKPQDAIYVRVHDRRRRIMAFSKGLNARQTWFALVTLHGRLLEFEEEQVVVHAVDNMLLVPYPTVQLLVTCIDFDDEGFLVFCHFLRTSSMTPLKSLNLCLFDYPTPRRLGQVMEALHTNTSVTDLKFSFSRPNDDAFASMMRHKTNISTLAFEYTVAPSRLPSILRHGYPNLRILRFHGCYFTEDDEYCESMVRGLVDGKNYQLEEIEISNDSHSPRITSRSLGYFCMLDPSRFRCLKTLIFYNNNALLSDTEITQQFVTVMLLPANTTMEKLTICCYGATVGSNIAIIKALETNRKLRWLRIAFGARDFSVVRHQFVESLPKMKGLQHLTCRVDLFNENDQELMSAFRQNTSLLSLYIPVADRNPDVDDNADIKSDRVDPVTTPLLSAIMKRNKL